VIHYPSKEIKQKKANRQLKPEHLIAKETATEKGGGFFGGRM